MLTLSKIYAVKTKHPRSIINYELLINFFDPNLNTITIFRCVALLYVQ